MVHNEQNILPRDTFVILNLSPRSEEFWVIPVFINKKITIIAHSIGISLIEIYVYKLFNFYDVSTILSYWFKLGHIKKI